MSRKTPSFAFFLIFQPIDKNREEWGVNIYRAGVDAITTCGPSLREQHHGFNPQFSDVDPETNTLIPLLGSNQDTVVPTYVLSRERGRL